MRYYHILVLGLFTLFTSCRMYEDMPSGDNYVSTAIAKDTQSLRQLLRSSEHGWMLTLVPGTGQYGGLNLSLKFTSDNEVTTSPKSRRLLLPPATTSLRMVGYA